MPFDGTEFGRRDRMLGKLDHVIDLLRSENKWCKQQLRTRNGRRCILGALADADAESLLSSAILNAARELTGRSYGRIDRFNDHPKTDHRLVLATLDRTRNNILLGKITPVRTVTVARRVRTFYSSLARLGA